MKDVSNQQFLEWLRPVKSKRRFELLNDIGLSLEKRGVPDEAIKKHYSQIQAHSYVVLEKTDDEILAETRLDAGSKIGLLKNDLSENNNEESVESARDSCSVLEQLHYPFQSLEDDEDSIEIALSEDSDPLETIYAEFQENESKCKPILQKEIGQTSNLQNLTNNKDFSNLKVHGFDSENPKVRNDKPANSPLSLLQNYNQSSRENDDLTENLRENNKTDKCVKITKMSHQSGREELDGAKSCEKDATIYNANETQVENSRTNFITMDTNMTDKKTSATEEEKKFVKDQTYNNLLKNNLALVDETIFLTKLQEKLGEKLKSKNLDIYKLGHAPKHEGKDVKDKTDNNLLNNNQALGDKPKSLTKIELTKFQEKLEEKFKSKNSDIFRIGHGLELKTKTGLTGNVPTDQNNKRKPLISVSKNLFESPSTGKETRDGGKVLEEMLKRTEFCGKTIIDTGSEANKQSKELNKPILTEGIVDNSIKVPMGNENEIKSKGTTKNKGVPESEEENTTISLENIETECDEPEIDINQWGKTEFKVFCKNWPVAEANQGETKESGSMISDKNRMARQHENKNSSDIQEHLNQFSSQVKRLEKHLSAKKQSVQLPENELKRSTLEKRRLSEQPSDMVQQMNKKKRRISENQDLSTVVKYPVPQVKTCAVALSTTSTAAAVDSLLSDNTVSSSTPSAYQEKVCEETSFHLVESTTAQKSQASLEKGESRHIEHPLQNLQTCVPLEVQRNLQVPPQESANATSVKERAEVRKAIKMFLFYFQNPENINDCIPFEFRSRLVQNIKAEDASNHNILFEYLTIYSDFVDEFVNIKINKCAEILHLAIADWNRKMERNNRALKLTSEILRNEEMKRAEADYNEMLLLRGNKFKEIFELLMSTSRFIFCEYPMLATLYFRITLALVSIDQENISHIYNIRVLILNLLKNCGYKFTSSCNDWFNQSNESLINTYHFVKHSLVALYLSGYNQKGAEDVMKFYHLHPCISQLKQMVLSGGQGHEAAIGAKNKSQGVEPVVDVTSSVESPKKQHTLYESLRRLGIQQKNRQASIEPYQQSILLRNLIPPSNPPQQRKEQRRVETVTQNPLTLTQQQNQIQAVLQSMQQSSQQPRMLSRPIQQPALQGPQRQRVLQTVYNPINQQQKESKSRGNYNSQNFETSQNVARNIQHQPSATIGPLPPPYQNHASAQAAQDLHWQNQLMQQGSNTSWNVVQTKHQFAVANQSSSTTLSKKTPDKPRVVPQLPSPTCQRAEPTNATPTDFIEDLAKSLCCRQGCKQLSIIVCSMCKIASYCSNNCQKYDWYNSHSTICLGLNQPSRAVASASAYDYRTSKYKT